MKKLILASAMIAALFVCLLGSASRAQNTATCNELYATTSQAVCVNGRTQYTQYRCVYKNGANGEMEWRIIHTTQTDNRC